MLDVVFLNKSSAEQSRLNGPPIISIQCFLSDPQFLFQFLYPLRCVKPHTLWTKPIKEKEKKTLFSESETISPPRSAQTFWNGLVEFIVKFRMGEGRVQADSL